ncbi:MAG: acyl-CoA thioesterase [Betaproteobacteria bacterium]|nr:acyl-CoA thioesterase [Betaproteobacteria bacterium]
MSVETGIETYRGVVYPWQIDHMDHMNVQFYTACFDAATWHLFAALGMTPGYLKQNRRGMAAVEQRTLYKRELHAGALIRITSELLEMKPKTMRFMHRMYDERRGSGRYRTGRSAPPTRAGRCRLRETSSSAMPALVDAAAGSA